MRKLKLHMQISVDGYVAGPNGELDWLTWNQDEKLKQFTRDLTNSSDTILLGRKMTEGFTASWEDILNNHPENPNFSLAKQMVEFEKIAFSKTVNSLSGKNVTVENGDLATAVKKLKAKAGKDIVVYGGAGFVSSLIKEGLIDEFNFFVNPVMISRGMRIFDLNDKRQKLSFLSSMPYECGITVLTYKLNND